MTEFSPVYPMSTLPAITVVIPTYNRAALLARALDSALAQDVPGLECLVLDDGSTDDTAEVVARRQDPRVVYHRQPNSGKPSLARNAALTLARGEIVAFLDSDDRWLPGRLAQGLEILHSRPDIGLVFTDFFVDHPQRGTCRRRQRLRHFGDLPLEPLDQPDAFRLSGAQARAHLLRENFIGLSTVMVRRALLPAPAFDPGLKIGEDLDLWLRLGRVTDFAYLDRPTLHYLLHPGGIMTDHEAQARDHETVLRRHMHGATPQELVFARQGLASHYLGMSHAALQHGQRLTALRQAARGLMLRPGLAGLRALLRPLVPQLLVNLARRQPQARD